MIPHVSLGMIDLISTMLMWEPYKRASTKECLNHPVMKDFALILPVELKLAKQSSVIVDNHYDRTPNVS